MSTFSSFIKNIKKGFTGKNKKPEKEIQSPKIAVALSSDVSKVPQKLDDVSLPVLRGKYALAKWLGISASRLTWFTYETKYNSVWHYVRHIIPKRNGGERVILAPKRELKALQRRVLDGILNQVPTSPQAHGFVMQRSITTNARPHVNKAVVINLDLKNFFPSVTLPRVLGIFRTLGYNKEVALALARLCTECDREVGPHLDSKYKDKEFFVSVTPRHLVQGAPTSPALSNLVCWKLDKRLNGLAQTYQFTYTRYADDLTFSGDDIQYVELILKVANGIVRDEGFKVNKDKTHVFYPSSRQVVTGLVVNDKVATPRQLRRQMRAIIHNAQFTGLEAQNYEQHPNFRYHLLGVAEFIGSTHPDKAEQMKQIIHALPS
ncbi:MAG: hypothetical protein B6242_13275 [Anaerolineaceae bacterium 4572_78]|nr:MAG: hypothetical protein B6242_13275 [Anaerolineaceae bacterium 4572_78]